MTEPAKEVERAHGGSLEAVPSSSSSGNSRLLRHRLKQLRACEKRVKLAYPEVPQVSPGSLRKLLADPATTGSTVLLDVRRPEEIAVSVLPRSLALDEFEEHTEEFRGCTIVCYDTVGYRAAKYARRLIAAGYDAKNLEGGIMEWTHKGYPLVLPGPEPQQETKRVHAYSADWALQADGYECMVIDKLKWLRSLLPSWLSGQKS